MAQFTWKAIYKDNTFLKQVNKDGTHNKYTDIDRSKLVKFILEKDNFPYFVLHLDSNKRLIYRRRVVMSLFSRKIQAVYLVGYQEKINGKNIQYISFFFEDGHIEVFDGFKENTSWFRPVMFLPDEMITQ